MQEIFYGDKLVAIISNMYASPDNLKFYGGADKTLQLATFRYKKDRLMRDHKHIVRLREIEQTQEVVFVFKGSCEVRLSEKENDTKILIHKQELIPGDFCIIYNCYVGYTILEEDTILSEVKVGPYLVKSDDEDRVLL